MLSYESKIRPGFRETKIVDIQLGCCQDAALSLDKLRAAHPAQLSDTRTTILQKFGKASAQGHRFGVKASPLVMKAIAKPASVWLSSD